jgi:hypothetical protein
MALVQINLLTKEFSTSNSSEIDNIIKVLVAVSIIGCIGVGVWQLVTIKLLNTQLNQAKARITAQQKNLTEVQKLKTLDDEANSRVALLNNTIKADKWGMNGLFASVQKKAPAGLNIATLNIKDGGVDMKVEANSPLDIEIFGDSLKTEKNFSEVDIQTLTQETGKRVKATLAFKFKGGQGK